VFGADDIRDSIHAVGSVVEGVWRPALYYQADVLRAVGSSETERRAAEQQLRLLVERFDELLLYIEPNRSGLKAYSHKTRELLILACAEVENSWKHYMRLAGATPTRGSDFSTKDYVRLASPLFLADYRVSLRPYGEVDSLRPFLGWDANAPTRSLPWYDAYNKTKHDRTHHFGEATLQNCLSAVAANLVMYCVRFSPSSLFTSAGTLGGLVNHLFEIELVDCDPTTFYIPLLVPPSNLRPDLVCLESKNWVQEWSRLPLKV
jgi:hypothetical protein